MIQRKTHIIAKSVSHKNQSIEVTSSSNENGTINSVRQKTQESHFESDPEDDKRPDEDNDIEDSMEDHFEDSEGMPGEQQFLFFQNSS